MSGFARLSALTFRFPDLLGQTAGQTRFLWFLAALVIAFVPAAPAVAQVEVWSGTLNVKQVSSALGCSDSSGGNANRCHDSAALSDDDFTHGGTDYEFEIILLDTNGRLFLEVDRNLAKATRSLTLDVEGTEFAFADADQSGSTYRGWSSSSLSWSAGQNVVLKLLAPSPIVVPADWSLIPSERGNTGDRFRLLFASSTTRNGSSADIAAYNNFVQSRAAAGHSDVRHYSWTFRAVGSTAAVDARDNTETTYTTGDLGERIYWLGGNRIANHYQDFYNGDWDDETNSKDESGNVRMLTGSVVDRPMTGSGHDGTEAFTSSSASQALGADNVRVGRPASSVSGNGPLSSTTATAKASPRPFYGLSAVFEVGEAVVANNRPVFPNSTADRTVAENSPGDQDVGTALIASDLDNDTLSYSLEGADDGDFTIVAFSGQIRTRADAAYDFETKSVYSVTVVADDGKAGGTAAVDVTIDVTDLVEPPGTPSAPSVAPASSSSVSVTWTAPSNTGPTISSYDLQYRQGSSGPWMVGPQDEPGTSATIGSLAADTSYEVQVRATNDEGDSVWSSAGSGRTHLSGNTAPVFGQSSETRSFRETIGGATVQSPADVGIPVTATDGDNDPLDYMLEGTDADKFTIVSATGQIRTKVDESYDWEAKSTYRVTVKADDGNGGSDTVAVTISVKNVDEPPLAPSGLVVTARSRTTLEVSWSAPDNTGRPRVIAYDMHYEFIAGASPVEGPHAVTGTSATIDLLNPDTRHKVWVLAWSIEGEGPWSAAVNGRTEANIAPVFPDPGTTRSVTEHVGRAMGRSAANLGDAVVATDGEGDALRYSLEGADAHRFTIVASTGQIRARVGQTYDHEADASHAVTVRAEDDLGGFGTTDVTIEVVDEDEPPLPPASPTVTSSSTTSVDVNWSAPDSTGRPEVTDYAVRYREGSTGAWVDGGSGLGAFALAASLANLEESTSYQVQVQATNVEGEGPWSPTGTGSTNSAGNAAPSFGPNSATWTLAEHVGPATVQSADDVGTAMTATDGDNDTLRYRLDGADASRFTIDSGTAQISTKVGQNYDRESRASYSVIVKVDDGNGGTAALPVTIDLTDENEPPLEPAAPSLSGTSASPRRLDVRWHAPPNAGRPPITGYELQYGRQLRPQYSGAGDPPLNQIRVDGPLTLYPRTLSETSATLLSLRARTHHVAQIRVLSADGPGPWSPFGIGLTGVSSTGGGGGGGGPSGPGAPTVDSVRASGRGSLGVSWSAPGSGASGVSSYDLRYIRSTAADKSDERWTVLTGIWEDGRLAYTLSGLADNSEYDIQVRAVAGSSPGPWSATGAGTTTSPPPPPPGPPMVDSVEASGRGALLVSWRAPVAGASRVSTYDLRHIESAALTSRIRSGRC